MNVDALIVYNPKNYNQTVRDVTMKILVTGGSGLVGRNLQQVLPDAQYVSSNMCDFRSQTKTNELFSSIKPTHVIHLAARVGGLFANKNDPVGFFEDNIKINTNVLRASYECGVTNLVGMLSTCIFPDSVEYPLQPHKIHLGEPHHSNFGYAYAKRMMEVQIRAYRQQFGLEWTTIIPTNVYGKFDNFDIKSAHVIPALIHKCYLAKKNNTDFIIMGDGSAEREFIYAEDLGQIIKWAIHNYTDELPLIASTPTQHSIRHVVQLITNIMQFRGNVIFEGSYENNGQVRKPSDTSEIQVRCPMKYTSLERGLQQTVDWFVNTYE